MSKKHVAAVAVAVAAALATPTAAAASSPASTTAPAAAAPAQELKLRAGLTLYIPIAWEVHRIRGDWINVVTGPCRKPRGGFFTPDCQGFWILGPKAIKLGAEGFGPYDAREGGYYPASDVQPCPKNGKLVRGERIGAHKKGTRQVGPGHKAHYHQFTTRCRTTTGKKVGVSFTTREWYLPKSKILVVDEWSTKNLADALKHADWR
ncbi:hypothetical protein ACQEUU_28770 [Nonomuraea sp. CA-218870]|uniref:hypothetical protein n=1 Tax=Nonomuraea sp. CA-218870 TaxID=3239998 RepID=UPI003D8AB203